jgi:hypothetical protein
MYEHPFFIERLAAAHYRDLLEAANDLRLHEAVRLARRRRLVELLARVRSRGNSIRPPSRRRLTTTAASAAEALALTNADR